MMRGDDDHCTPCSHDYRTDARESDRGAQPAPDAAIDAARVRSYLRERLAGYKIPRLVECAAELPPEDSGKIFKREPRDPLRAGTGRSI